MLSIYKFSKEDFNTIFAISFSENDHKLFFYVDGTWEEDLETVDFIYGEKIDINSLKSLDLAENLELSDDVLITCLGRFDNLGESEEDSNNIHTFLDSYSQMMKLS